MRTDNGDNNVLEAYATDGLEDCIIRRGFRGGTFVATYKFKWNDSSTPGFLVRWLTPGDYLALGISADDDKPRLYRRRLDGTLTTLVTAGSGLGLSNAEWYEAKVVITESGGDQLLNYYVDTNQDSDCRSTSDGRLLGVFMWFSKMKSPDNISPALPAA